MATVTGVIDYYAFPDKFNKCSIKVGDKFYSSKFEIRAAKKGDRVQFDDGGKNYINNLIVLGKAEDIGTSNQTSSNASGSSQYRHPDEIIRQQALSDAVSFVTYFGKVSEATVERVLTTASIFESFVKEGQESPFYPSFNAEGENEI